MSTAITSLYGFEVRANAGRPRRVLLSRTACMLHAAAVVDGVRDGHPGFVSDDRLYADHADVHPDVISTVAELVASGMWDRVSGGYRVGADR